MAKNTPAKNSGGQGFNYEDHVAATFMLGLLGSAHPLGSGNGTLKRIDWQAKESGWHLDDLMLTFGQGESERTAGISIKSSKKVTESGFSTDFVEPCWAQWTGLDTRRKFRMDRDLMVLVTSVLALGIRTAWDHLLNTASAVSAAPERMAIRLQQSKNIGDGSHASELQRTLFASFHCPASLYHTGNHDEVETAKLLRHVRVIHLDFESEPSQALEDSLERSRSILRSGTSESARSLWNHLTRIASQKRGRGGSIDLPELLVSFRGQFELSEHPDYQNDWTELSRRSKERYELIGQTVGGGIRLSRRSTRRRMSRHFQLGRFCVLIGASGVGKSAIARRFGETRYRLVWLSTELFRSGRESDFEALLGLRHSLSAVIAASSKKVLVVVDGSEGLEAPGLQLAAKIIASLLVLRVGSPRIVLTVQPDGIARLHTAFAMAGIPALAWRRVIVRQPSQTVVDQLLARFPDLKTASFRPEFRALLRNLKVFDWVVRFQRSGGFVDKTIPKTLTALIDLMWAHIVEDGPAGLAGAALLKRIGAAEADRLIPGMPSSEAGAEELSSVAALKSTDVVCVSDEQIRFVHDMFADWARLKHLVEQRLEQSEATIRRAATPGWFRAVRLYAQRLLEMPGDGASRWLGCVRSLGTGSPEHLIIRDLFLEALVIANDSETLLKYAWPALVSDDGELLHRLLDRFIFIGTVPDHRILSSIQNRKVASELEHLVRTPFEPYWTGVLAILAEKHDDVIRCALAPAAKLFRLCLGKVRLRPDTESLRLTAAKLCLIIGREVQTQEAEGKSDIDDEVRTELYVALLWSAVEYPEEFARLCLELTTRRPESESVRLRREAARERNRLETERMIAVNPAASTLLRPPSIFAFSGSKRPPWMDGPSSEVDEAFQKACLDHTAVMPLVVKRPKETLEILLAVLIEPPKYYHHEGHDDLFDSLGLDQLLPGQPAFYSLGPFWTLLRQGQVTAEFCLTLVIKVVTSPQNDGGKITITTFSRKATIVTMNQGACGYRLRTAGSNVMETEMFSDGMRAGGQISPFLRRCSWQSRNGCMTKWMRDAPWMNGFAEYSPNRGQPR
ncbi:hypothetical protein [Zavarzinella formosa]|uniref:hypothetical protein n=1 Tax=Zavarzinella formosa TaxID=360055 RepID=UPI0002F13167|nr:hypothetical protein [Zavarzinella formosa]